MNNVKKGVYGFVQSAKSMKVLFELPRPKNAGRSAAAARDGWLFRRLKRAEKSGQRAWSIAEEALAKVKELEAKFCLMDKERAAVVENCGRGVQWGPKPHP